MNKLFGHISSSWLRYSSYEYRTGTDGVLYLTTSKDATVKLYNPMENAEQLILDAVHIGRMGMNATAGKKTIGDAELKDAVLDFVQKYGFLGFITALPTTAKFTEYEYVYLPKNHFINEEKLSTEDYLAYFFPFTKLDFQKKGVNSGWLISDRTNAAIAMALGGTLPDAVIMSFQREYAERYDWLIREFNDIAFVMTSRFLYYIDKDKVGEDTLALYRQGVEAFGNLAPTYHIALGKENPVLVWDFHSLLVMMQMCFSTMVTDPDKRLRLCKNCLEAFFAENSAAEFCCPACEETFHAKEKKDKDKKKKHKFFRKD